MYHRGGHELSSYLEDIGEDDRDEDTVEPLVDSRNYVRPKLSDVDEGNSLKNILMDWAM